MRAPPNSLILPGRGQRGEARARRAPCLCLVWTNTLSGAPAVVFELSGQETSLTSCREGSACAVAGPLRSFTPAPRRGTIAHFPVRRQSHRSPQVKRCEDGDPARTPAPSQGSQSPLRSFQSATHLCPRLRSGGQAVSCAAKPSRDRRKDAGKPLRLQQSLGFFLVFMRRRVSSRANVLLSFCKNHIIRIHTLPIFG